MELTIFAPTSKGSAPLQLFFNQPNIRFAGTILVYHGLGVSKEVQRKECEWLAAAGFLAVAVDAVGHGTRRFHDFDDRLRDPGKHHALLEMVLASAEEVPSILDALIALIGDRTGRFGITGISMGGYICFAAALREPRLEAVVPILGCPDWTIGAQSDDPILHHSPHLHPEKFPPKALLVFNAGNDTDVPPESARNFVNQLHPLYAGIDERILYREYPNSSHFMLEEDWNDLWQHAIQWLLRHLA